NITENTNSAAVIVERDDTFTTDEYTVTVKSKLSSPLIIDGVTAAVTDSDPGTEYQVKDGPTFTATDKFTVVAKDANKIFTETGEGLTVTSGSVTTSDADAKIDISAVAGDATVTISDGTAGIAANDAVIKTAENVSITLTESGTATATVVNKDGSVSGLDGGATVKGVPVGKLVVASGAGTFSVNGISVTISGSGGGITPDAVEATNLTLDKVAGVTSFSGGTISFTAATDTSYTIVNQTIAGGNGKTVGFLSTDSDKAYLYSTSGAITLGEGYSIDVSDSSGNKTSTIVTGTSVDVAVSNGTYVISGLDDNGTVTIDSVAYTYNASTKKLLNNGIGWQLTGDSIGFTIQDGTDTFITTYGAAVVPDLTTELAEIMGRMQSAGTLYFSAAGLQQPSDSGAAYTLERDDSGNYALTSTSNANTTLTIDLTNVDGSKLTIDFSADGATAQNLKLGASTTLAGLTLGAEDSVLASDGTTVLAQAGAAGSVATVKESAVNLTKGTFVGVGTTVNNIAAAEAVTIDGVTFAAGAAGTFTNGDKDTFAVTAGTASIGTGFNGDTVTANGVEYTVGNGATTATFSGNSNSVSDFAAGTISFTAADDIPYTIGNQIIADGNGNTVGFVATGSNQAYLYSTSGAITLGADKSIDVSNPAGTKTSRIAAGTSVDVSVSNGTYEISSLDDNETVTIDGATYTYNAETKKLLKDGFGWALNNNAIGFTIENGTDTFITTYGTAVVPDLTTELAEIMGRMQSAGTLYFSAAGLQQPSDSGAAYTLERDDSGNYALTSTSSANTTLTIDLTNVDGSNLTIDFSTDGATAQNVKLGADTTLAVLTLGAGDSVLNGKDNALATAGNASGTVTVAKGEVTALTGGTFVGVGEHTIAATADVTIDGVTFAAGATGTFTNGTTDTFAVTAGTASIGTGFNGTKVTANGVDYTVESGTEATLSGNANTVKDFTAGKITFAAADNTPYTIGEQTISDGNGATLTFVPAGLYSTDTGKISLGAGKSITISDENGTNTRQIAAGTGSALDVAAANGEYTISGLDALGESVDIVDSSNSKMTYEVVDVKSTNVVLRKTVNGTDTYWQQTTTDATVTDSYSGTELQGGTIVTSAYNTASTETYFLANGLPYATKDNAAATLTVDDKGNKELKVKPALTVNVEATDNVKIIDGGTATAYTLAADSHVKTKDAMTFTTTRGVVSDATGTLVLQGASDSLTVKGTVNVDASSLIVRNPMLRSMSLGSVGTPGVTYQHGTAVNGAVLTLAQGKSLTLAEANNSTDTVYTAKTLTGLDSGAEITANGLSDGELASVATATGGTFTVNGITFSATSALTVTSVAEAAKGTLIVDSAITTGTEGKNYKVGNILYKSVSAGVALASDKATLLDGQSVTVDGHDKVTNNGETAVTISSDGVIKLAAGQQFTMGNTAYSVDADKTSGYVGTEEKTIPKEGYVVTVTTKVGAKRYILSEKELSNGVSVTDKLSEQGEVWADADEDLLLPSIPITVDGASESAAYNNAGFVTTKTEDTVATVTKKDDGTYTVAVTGKVLLGVEIDGVKATLTDSGSGTEYKTGNGTFQLNGTGTLENGLLTFDKAGSSVTINGYTYTFDKVNDKISLDTTGKLTGLTDGEKVTVTNKDGATITYEVSGGELLLTKNEDGKTTTTTNLLAAGETDGFIILEWKMEAVNMATETSKTQDDTGLEVNTEGVDKITDGILLDESGQATLAEDKAIATVTIQQDESLKYTAKENKGQDIKITNKSSKTWEINASNKKDTIEYEGRGEAVIFAGDGNDSVSITGSGEVQVFGDSGKNAITHTGTGDSTLQGGTGNDTIKSYHADDVILGGEGNNTFVLTNVETKVSDFTYGQDKAIVSSSTGALAIGMVNAGTDGTISYSGTGGASGALDVSEQDYGDFYAVTLADAKGRNKLNVGWLGNYGGTIDASSQTERLLLIGNSEGNVHTLGGQKFTDTLIGGQSKDTIIAGTGASSLWGGAGNDLIESNSEASHTIFFLEGDGNDTVTGFTAYGEDSADTLDFLGQSITKVKHTSQGIQLYHGSDKMTLTGNFNANTMIKWESGDAQGVAKIGRQGEDNKLSYNEDVNVYLGSTGKDTISIGADDDNVEVWLDGSRGVHYDSVEIIDASSSNGTVILAGGEGKQTITGGKGNSSLWGGTGSATDVLNGGSGEDVFYYGKEEGNDIVNNASADDKVMLYNLSLGDLKEADIDTNKVTITQQNGQTLTINGRAGEFTLSDGSTWAADYSTKTWNRVK
ncbi:MAG: hypothetical protein IJU00_06455, partial [Selenomonas sp.]|nr:hypothetical protein [Selenomonas sp.]